MPNQTCQSKTNLATQAYWAKPTKPNPPIQTKLLGKAVDAWVRSAFGNVSFLFCLPTLCRCPWCSVCWRTCVSPSCRSSSSDPPQAAYKFTITKKCKNLKGKVAPTHHLCHAQKLKQLIVYLHGKNRAKATAPLGWQIFIYGQLLGVAQIHFVPIHYILYHDQCQGMASPILRLLFPQKTLDSELNIKLIIVCLYLLWALLLWE